MTAISDLTTVLRHVVDNVQWGGNQGAKVEAMEALDRLTSNKYADASDAPETPETPPTPAKSASARRTGK